MNIKVNDPPFLLAILKDEVVNRTRYLISQGIAYDSDWRDGFAELFQVIEQLEQPPGDKLESETLYKQPRMDQDDAALLEQMGSPTIRGESEEPIFAKEVTLKQHQSILMAEYPLGTPVTLGKGKTIWTIDGHKGQTIHLSRPGPGKNSMYATPDKIKLLPNQWENHGEA